MTLLRVLSSDCLKTKRTAIRLIAAASPVAYALAMLWYLGHFTQTQDLQYKIHEVFFQAGTIFLPIVVGLLAGLICAQEEHAGNFNGMMGQMVPKALIYISKLLLLTMLVIVITFSSIFILLLGMKLLLHIGNIRVELFLLSGFLTIAGSLTLCSIHLFLGLAYGLGTSISVGGAGFLIAAILGATSVGDTIWQFMPWAWPVRLSWLPAIFMPGVHLPDNIMQPQFFLQQTAKGLVPAITVFIFVTVCSILWFYRWEGRKSYE